MIMRSTLIPIAAAVSRSWAVARMALPHRVLVTNTVRPSIRGPVMMTTNRSLVVK
jgi:hypothetical protein